MSLEDEYRIDELTTQVEDLQDEIQSMEADIMLLQMEVVQRGDYIRRLESQNQLLKKQLMSKVAGDSKVAAYDCKQYQQHRNPSPRLQWPFRTDDMPHPN